MFRKSLAIVSLAALAALGLAQLDANKVVAVVNGEEIKAGEYYTRMEFLQGVGKRIGDRYAEFTPGFMTVEQLITERLILQLAKQKGVLPTDAEVQAEFTRAKTLNPNLEQQWSSSGRTIPMLMQEIRLDLAQFKIRTFGITITDQEVQDFYKKNPSMFTRPKMAKLRVIVVPDEATKTKADAELTKGTAFGQVAKAMSIDVTKVAEGLIGEVPFASLNGDVRKNVEAIKIGQMTPWMSTADRFVRFKLEDVLPEQLKPYDATLRDEIRKKLMSDRGAVKNNVKKEMADLRAKAKVDIKNPEFAEVYRRFIESDLAEEGVKSPAKP